MRGMSVPACHGRVERPGRETSDAERAEPPAGARSGSRGRGGRRRGAGSGNRERPGGAQLRRRAPEDLVPRQNIGIQLYSLRDMQAASVQNTINLLGGIGYPEVELFTMQGQTAATWRGILEGANVRAIAAHVGIDRWRNELDTVLNEAETLGMQYVGVPGIFPNPPATRETYRGARARVQSLRGAGRRPRDAVLLPQPQLRVRPRRRDPAVRHPPRPDGSRPRLLRDGPVLDGDGRRRPARLPRALRPVAVAAVPRQGP